MLIAAAGAWLSAAQMRGPSQSDSSATDALFDDTVLQEIRLAVNADDWQRLKDHYLENTYYPADFRWRDQVVRNVGIRSKGTGSRSPVKPHLGIDFGRYTSDQQFLGLKAVVVRNNTQDPSNLHERLSMLLFRRLGLPASREAHATLYVNNEYVGLYTIVEPIDTVYLQRTTGEDSGYLYSYDYPATAPPYHFEYRGSDPGLYVPLPFKPETHGSDPRGEFIEQMVWTINETTYALFHDRIGSYLDVASFLRHVAIDNFLTDNDGILGDWGMNNAYLYRFDNTTRFTFFPWDKSEGFKGGVDFSIFHGIAGMPQPMRNRLMDKLLEFSDFRSLYLDALVEVVRSADEPLTGTAGPGWLEREVQREYAQIHQAALADPKKPYTNDEFEQAISDLLVFARGRGDFVLQSVNLARLQLSDHLYRRRSAPAGRE